MLTPEERASRAARRGTALLGRAIGFLAICRDVLDAAQELLPKPDDKKTKRARDQVQRAIETLCPQDKRKKGGT
jgi:hypothetical protein